MIESGFSREGFQRYLEALEACDDIDEAEDVVEKILKEGSAEYYGYDGKWFEFDKYDLEEIYR